MATGELGLEACGPAIRADDMSVAPRERSAASRGRCRVTGCRTEWHSVNFSTYPRPRRGRRRESRTESRANQRGGQFHWGNVTFSCVQAPVCLHGTCGRNQRHDVRTARRAPCEVRSARTARRSLPGVVDSGHRHRDHRGRGHRHRLARVRVSRCPAATFRSSTPAGASTSSRGTAPPRRPARQRAGRTSRRWRTVLRRLRRRCLEFGRLRRSSRISCVRK